MQLKLIVIRTGDMPKLVGFYSSLGLRFEYHKHGTSPYHYSAEVGETIIEIYRLQKGKLHVINTYAWDLLLKILTRLLRCLIRVS